MNYFMTLMRETTIYGENVRMAKLSFYRLIAAFAEKTLMSKNNISTVVTDQVEQ